LQHRSRNFCLTLGVCFFIYFNFFSFQVITPQYLTDLGGTGFQAGLQNSFFFIAGILLRLYFGPMADSRGRKIPILIGAFVFATTPLLFLISHNVPMIFVSRFYQAIGLAAFFSSGTSLISDIAPPQKMGTYMGSYRFTATMALVVGPGISIALINNFGYSTQFIFSFFIGMISFTLGAFLVPPDLKASKVSKNPIYQLKTVLNNKLLWPIYLGAGIVAFSYGTLLTFGSIYFSRATDVANPGLYFTIFALLGMVGNISAGGISDKIGRRAVVTPSLTLLGLGIFILYFLPGTTSLLWISSIITGLGYGGSITAIFTWITDVTEQKARATALAFQESALDIAYASGSFLFGISVSLWDYGPSFSLIGIITIFTAAFFLVGGKERRKKYAQELAGQD